jgi:hypothetical protein
VELTGAQLREKYGIAKNRLKGKQSGIAGLVEGTSAFGRYPAFYDHFTQQILPPVFKSALEEKRPVHLVSYGSSLVKKLLP